MTKLLSSLSTRSLLALAGLAVAMTPQVSRAQQKCSLATLRGDYVMSGSGTAGGAPVAVIAKVTFDGQGKGVATETVSVNGTILRGITATGIYTVNEDCTGSKTFTSGGQESHFDFVVTADGEKINWIETDAGTVWEGTATRSEHH